MQRFIAFFWSQQVGERESGKQHALALLRRPHSDWQTVLETSSASILGCAANSSGIPPQRLGDRGAVFGQVFARDSVDSCICERDQAAIVRTHGAFLIDHYWGRYVAFMAGDGAEHFVLRDPTGGLPCYYIQTATATIVFSHLEDYLDIVPARPSINWRHIGAYLQCDRVVSSHTGYEGLMQLQAGHCLRIANGSCDTHSLWDPVNVCKAGMIEDAGQAGELIGTTVRGCISSWASSYRSVLHDLSGGLDSSIVAACLAQARSVPTTLCFNVYSPNPEGDERYFARKMAQRAGFELIERLIRPPAGLELKLQTLNLASPTLVSFVPENDGYRASLARERGVEAIFSGQGGDHLFQQTVSSLIPAEYVQRHGLGRRLSRILFETARSTGKPLLSVAADALRRGVSRGGVDFYGVFTCPDFVRAGVSDLVRSSDIRHPWVERAESLPAAKQEQVFALVDCQILTSMRCSYAEIVHPLISQPIIEACLSIPSYVLADGGRDRALLRKTFSADVPHEIIARTQKGGADAYFHNMLRNNLQYMRELLLDGQLVREQLLDRAKLERALTLERILRSGETVPILTAVRAEAWLQSASGRATPLLLRPPMFAATAASA